MWRLGHRPALDGLRGVAILSVLVAHFDAYYGDPFDRAGTIGVLMFFTLSGFLITSLLYGEHTTSGHVSLSAFYKRRAFRLLPALVAMLVFVVTMEAIGQGNLGVQPGDLAASLFYYSNIWQIIHPGLTGIAQTWSLSIEEQFYLLWPAAFILASRWGRQGVVRVAVGGVVVSVVAMFLPTASTDRGSLEHAAALLAGCLFAVWMHGRTEGRTRPGVAALVLLALGAVVAMRFNGPDQAYLIGVPVAMVVLLWAVAQGPGPRWLANPVLRWFGRRSYGIYLWHYPIIHSLPFADPNPPPWLLPVTVGPLCLLAAELSWWLIERPAQRLGRRSGDPRDAADEVEGADALSCCGEGAGDESHVSGGQRLGQGVGRLEPRYAVD